MPRDASSQSRYHSEAYDPAKIRERALALLPETRERFARRADKLRRGAARTCPACLYDVRGILDGDEEKPCPECGEPVSLPANTLIWGEWAMQGLLARNIALLAGPVMGVVLSLFIVLESSVGWSDGAMWNFIMLAGFLAFAAGAGAPFGAAFAAMRWLRLRNPLMPMGAAIACGVLIGALSSTVMIGIVIVTGSVLNAF